VKPIVPVRLARAAGGGGVGSTLVWSGSDKTAGWSVSESGVRATNGTGGLQSIRMTQGISGTDKRVFALELITHGSGSYLGINDPTVSISSISSRYWLRNKSGSHFTSGVTQAGSSSFGTSNGDKFVFAVDYAARKLWIAFNGVSWQTGDPATGASPYLEPGLAWDYVGLLQDTNSSMDVRILSGATFPYAIPSGFL